MVVYPNSPETNRLFFFKKSILLEGKTSLVAHNFLRIGALVVDVFGNTSATVKTRLMTPHHFRFEWCKIENDF